MHSTSTHSISWLKPEIVEEQWEFSHHPAKQEYYLRHGIDWEQLLAAFEHGRLVPYPRANRILDIPVALCYHTYEDYARYLARAKRGYRRNYAKMEEELQRSGTMALTAPIILCTGGEALLFSGYRRLCLAWNYGILPYVWLVPVK